MFRFFILCFLLWSPTGFYSGYSQEAGMSGTTEPSEMLFADQSPLSLSLKSSIKSLKRETNDSTYLEGTLGYNPGTGVEDSMAIKVRARGEFRKSNCYFAPLKLKFKKSAIRGTLFEGNKELKLVLPCLVGSSSDDYVLKEFLAYKLYEVVSPYHYKTRLVRVDFTEIKGRRERSHELLGFLVEDHGTLAKRLDGKRYRAKLPPQMQDAKASIQNNMFQYAIGNTDFSIRQQHNQKLYYLQGVYLSIPYDFDMSGLVNAPYAIRSNVQTLGLPVSDDVRDRAYKGFKRDALLMQEVRRQFLEAKPELMKCLYDVEPYFRSQSQYSIAEAYLEDFFRVLEDDLKFEREILSRMRD
jgi:hypothetical protein